MEKLSLIQQLDGSLKIDLDATHISLQKKDYNYVLCVNYGNSKDTITIRLNPILLKTLGFQILPSLMDEEITDANIVIESVYREEVKDKILNYDDRSIQILIREIPADILVDFLWYMKNKDIILKILSNCSKRASKLLFEQLQHKWTNKNPDNCSIQEVKLGRKALFEICETMQKLRDFGEIL